MKNLINAITANEKKALETFISEINQETDISKLSAPYSYYWHILPKGKNVKNMGIEELRAYLIKRKEKTIYKQIKREVNQVKSVFEAGELVSVQINIEWKRSRMWGYNPKAEAWATFIDKDGNRNSRYVTDNSVSGCGYDKKSTAVANCLNQFEEVLKPLYKIKDKAISARNGELLGYGSGYSLLPRIEGGVGVSCYPAIFEKAGYTFDTVASGDSFDVFSITKK